MKTDNLINAIAADATARLPSMGTRVLLGLVIGGSLAMAVFGLYLGVRPDVASALQTWRFSTKLITTLLCFGSALWAVTRLARPHADRRAVIAALSLPLLVLAFGIGWELVASPAHTWSSRAMGSNSRLCVTFIATMSIAPLVALLLALRAGAPQSPATTGAAAGLVAGGLAATLYAIHCPDDSPLFVALWYVPVVALITLAGALAGRRVLRW